MNHFFSTFQKCYKDPDWLWLGHPLCALRILNTGSILLRYPRNHLCQASTFFARILRPKCTHLLWNSFCKLQRNSFQRARVKDPRQEVHGPPCKGRRGVSLLARHLPTIQENHVYVYQVSTRARLKHFSICPGSSVSLTPVLKTGDSTCVIFLCQSRNYIHSSKQPEGPADMHLLGPAASLAPYPVSACAHVCVRVCCVCVKNKTKMDSSKKS